MKNDRTNATFYPTVSHQTLASEIENAQEVFEASSHWLFSLAEHTAAFPELSGEASELLERLRRRALKGKLKKDDRKNVYAVLKTFRLYSRKVANEDKPLSCLEAAECVTALEQNLKQLRRTFSPSKSK